MPENLSLFILKIIRGKSPFCNLLRDHYGKIASHLLAEYIAVTYTEKSRKVKSNPKDSPLLGWV